MSAPAAAVGRRRRLGRAFAEMHYQLRTGADSPMRTALSVWLGVVIGCMPFYGFHLPLCLALGTLFRLSRIKCYLAAHINNPLSAPVLLYAAAFVGRGILTGDVPALGFRAWKEAGLLAIGGDLLVGSLVLGIVLGGALAVVAFGISSRWQRPSSQRELIDRVSRRYLDSGILCWEFVRGKLRHDPVYVALLAEGVLPPRGRLVDLGCGRGILLALLDTVAGTPREALPPDWPDPPRELALSGIDASPRAVAVAREALGEQVSVEVADLEGHRPPPCDVAVLLDVLHYLDGDLQERVLSSVVASLRPGALLVIREPDASGGLRFRLTALAERMRAMGRGSFAQRFAYRPRAEWIRLLEDRGLVVESRPMSRRTPFANVLILGSAREKRTGPGGDGRIRAAALD